MHVRCPPGIAVQLVVRFAPFESCNVLWTKLCPQPRCAYSCEIIGYLLLCIWHIVKLIERGDKIARFFDVKVRGRREKKEKEEDERERENVRKSAAAATPLGERQKREPREGESPNLRPDGEEKERSRARKAEGKKRARSGRAHAGRETESTPSGAASSPRAALSVMNPRGRCETTRTVRILSFSGVCP